MFAFGSKNNTPFEFIRRVLQHILPFSVQKVRYYGIYANKFRGKHPRSRGMAPVFKAESKATVGHLENIVEVWKMRRREIDTMLRECRSGA